MSLRERNNLSESFPAVPPSVPLARGMLAAFADMAGASDEQVQAVRLAASEALTNVVMHAYPGEPGEIHLEAASTPGELWVLVADDGSGLRPRAYSPGLGIGLALIAHSTDDFSVVRRAGGGTELRMRFSLGAASLDPDGHCLGSLDSASRPASPRFSTTR